jgi:DNA helicase II / ATP-dependent DNA helicase PcrA
LYIKLRRRYFPQASSAARFYNLEMNDLLKTLNPPQLEAVTLPSSSALVLAGAGSGKTKVLTTRIAWRIQTAQASPMNILAVTFTNKAAKEMLHRLSAMLPINTRGMWVGTFHGLCNRFLRTHYREANLPQVFQILDTQDQLSLIKRLFKANNVDDEKFPPKQFQWFIASAKEEGLRANAVEAFDDFSKKQVEYYALYEQACQREGVVDFAELLLRTYEVLLRNQPLREHYQMRFTDILVDEFQDTNSLQYKWLRQIAGPNASVFAVGDDDQSIYAFRGAKVGNMQSFERDYAPVKLVKLEQNYRSYGNILDAANALIDNNNGRLGKNLWTDAGKGEKIRGFLAYSDAEEAAFIVDCAKQAVNEGVIASEIAILYRSNAQSRVLEHALFNARMPYKVYGGLRFFERAEIKNALAYLRLIANQDDDGALLRVINFPPRGIGARTLETLQETAQMAGVTLWQAACGGAGGAGRARESMGGFVRLVESMRAATKGLPLPEVMDHMIEASGLLGHYATEKDGQDRADNLKELVTAADNFMREAGGVISTMEDDGTISGDPLIDFLTHAALEAGDTQAAEGKPAVQMMTVHAAKGLEFDQVFITGLEEGLFPHDNSIKDDNGVEEERRLMYVAITRARKKLTITHTQMRMMHGQTRYNIASRFLEEIPEALLQWLSPKPRAFASADYETSGYGAKSATPAYAAAAPAAQKSSGTDSGYRIGQNVLHAKFGAGVIVNAEGRGGDARVQVNFRDAGMKLLDLKFAKLTVV